LLCSSPSARNCSGRCAEVSIFSAIVPLWNLEQHVGVEQSLRYRIARAGARATTFTGSIATIASRVPFRWESSRWIELTLPIHRPTAVGTPLIHRCSASIYGPVHRRTKRRHGRVVCPHKRPSFVNTCRTKLVSFWLPKKKIKRRDEESVPQQCIRIGCLSVMNIGCYSAQPRVVIEILCSGARVGCILDPCAIHRDSRHWVDLEISPNILEPDERQGIS
jgi:hypothetical protein